ncbi:MAG: ABC-2 type transport system ATP-binding protein [Halobacteriales archaeon]
MASTVEPVVEVTDLTKEYGSLTAVDGVSFEIRPDEIFALVGPNGAGKTTTVEILECLRTPTSGSATVVGHDVLDEARTVKEQIGVVPQSFDTFDRLTVQENVALARRMYDDGLAVDKVLDQLDIEEWADTRFSDLSGGLQQRTGIAMALVSDPAVLFLDEPTTGLDPAARRSTWQQIERLADLGTAVVLTTHYMEEVEELADRAALLVEGSLEAVDSVEALVDRYGGDVKLVVSDGEEREGDGQSREGGAVESTLRSAATEIYRDDTGNLVGLFDDRETAQETFGRIHRLEGSRSIQLTTAGMEDVFLRLVGTSMDRQGQIQ